MPSIMRAPPEAETMISGVRVSSARSTARAMVSPTTAPMLPPIKAYSITRKHDRLAGRISPTALTIASFSPVFFCASASRRL